MTWQALNLAADVYSKPSEPPIRCGLIYAGKRHLISGPPEAAKTLLALIFAIEEIRAGGTVAIIDFESGPAETRRLLEDLGATLEEISDDPLLRARRRANHSDDLAAIVEAGVTLAIIDALAGAYDASGLDDEKRREVETVRPHLDQAALAAGHRDDRDRPRRQEPREPRQVLDRLRAQTRHRRRPPRA